MKPTIVLISGKMGSGKTTLGEGVVSRLTDLKLRAIHYTFAGPLYEMHRGCLQVLDRYGIQTPRKDGALLQLLGTEWGRKQYGENIWVEICKKRIEKDRPDVAVISDARFPNEVSSFLPGAITVRLDCPERVRRERILATPGQNWRENTAHPSETALDYFDEWSMRIDSEYEAPAYSVERVVREIEYQRLGT